MVCDQVCDFGDELGPLARHEGDGFDRTDRDARAAAGAGGSIDDGAPPLAGQDSNGGVLAGFNAAAADDAMPLDTRVGRGKGGDLKNGPLLRTRSGCAVSGSEGKNGGQQ
jgi:hypothetical protein